jgi:hypothetical protein
MSGVIKLGAAGLFVLGAVFAQDPPVSGGCWPTTAGGCVASGTTTSGHMTSGHLERLKPTFYKDVVSILQANCQSCHRPGGVSTTSFLDYKTTRPWAKAIKGMVSQRNMAATNPHSGKFGKDGHLSEGDILTLAAWADAGAPEGDAKDAPKPK